MLDIYRTSEHHVLMEERVFNIREPDLLSGRQAVELLPGITYTTLMRWAREGRVPSTQYVDGGKRLFLRSDIEALKAPKTTSAPSVASAPSTERLELPGQDQFPL